jgi:PAS domain-containing protein
MTQFASQLFLRPPLEKLHREIERTKSLIQALGIPMTHFPNSKTIQKMTQLSEAHVDRLCFQLRVTQYLSTLSNQEALESAAFQSELLKKALDFFGLESISENIPAFEADDIIEVYNSDSIQLYRSLNFFEYSSYSLEDLLLNEWFHLWERPSWAIEQLMALVQQTLSGQSDLITNPNVTPHLLREILDDGNGSSHRLLRQTMKTVFALRKKGSRRIGGFVSVCKAEILASGKEAIGLDFI